MDPNAVVDIAIGLVLMYLVLSLGCTALNELVATIVGMRAKTLESTLAQLIDVPQLKADFYNHGLIDGAKIASNGNHPSYLPGRTFAMALLGSLDPAKPIPAFADIEDSVRHLPDSNVRDMLLANLTTAQGRLETLRDGVATSFDHAMDRLSGVYKRKLKYLTLAIGFALAVSVNADTIAVAKRLWQDASLREQMVQDARGIVLGSAPPSPMAAAATPQQVIAAVQSAEDELRPLPVGWDFGAKFDYWNWHGLLKLGGLMLTAVALSLGAPFWFDLLSKFMRIRGVGDKPARTEDAS